MDRKNFISRLFIIGIAAVIPKAFMKPNIYKGAIFKSVDGRNYIRSGFRGECGGPELYIPQESGKIIPIYLSTNEIIELLRFEAYKDS